MIFRNSAPLFLLLMLLAPFSVVGAQEPDVSFDAFLEELLQEIEKESQAAQEKKSARPAPVPQQVLPPAPLSSAPAETDEVATDPRSDFLRAHTFPAGAARPRLPQFKEDALEHYLRSLRGKLEDTLQAIGALDAFERKQFKRYEKPITHAITNIGHVLSKRTYERALYDKSFNTLRTIIVELERVLRGVEAEIVRRSEQEESAELVALSVPSSTAKVLKSVRDAFAFDIPTVGKNLEKVIAFSSKSIAEKRKFHALLEKESQQWLAHIDARKPLPHYPARPSYSGTQYPGQSQRRGGGGGYEGYSGGGYRGGAPYDYYPQEHGSSFSPREAKRGTSVGSGKQVKQADKPTPEASAKEVKDYIWDELRKSLDKLEALEDEANRLSTFSATRLNAELEIFERKLSAVEGGLKGTHVKLSRNTKRSIAPIELTKVEQAQTRAGKAGWQQRRVGTMSEYVAQAKKWLGELKDKQYEARFNGLHKIRRKLLAVGEIAKALRENPPRGATRGIGEEMSLPNLDN